MRDFSFQGKIFLGERLAGGRPGALRWVGDAPACNVELATENETRRESYSGQRLTSATLQTSKEATIALTLNYADAPNLALGLYGEVKVVVGASATGEALPAGLAEGDYVALQHGNVSAVVITDSAGVPATLTAGTDYTVDSAAGGVILFHDISGFTQPLEAAYTYGGSTDVLMFNEAPPERFLFLDGINTVDNSPVRVEIYRTKFNPAGSIPLINEGFGQLELTGTVLFDSEADLDEALGGFGRIRVPTES